MTQKITPFLWFDGHAEEAMQFYVSTFKHSSIDRISRVGDGGPVFGAFTIEGQSFYALDGGPYYKLTPAFSIFVDCATQDEVDELWDKLLAGGGEPSQCGWLTDRFGLSWQIIPTVLNQYLSDPDPEKSGRVMQAMLQMVKLDIEGLRRAYEGV